MWTNKRNTSHIDVHRDFLFWISYVSRLSKRISLQGTQHFMRYQAVSWCPSADSKHYRVISRDGKMGGYMRYALPILIPTTYLPPITGKIFIPTHYDQLVIPIMGFIHHTPISHPIYVRIIYFINSYNFV